MKHGRTKQQSPALTRVLPTHKGAEQQQQQQQQQQQHNSSEKMPEEIRRTDTPEGFCAANTSSLGLLYTSSFPAVVLPGAVGCLGVGRLSLESVDSGSLTGGVGVCPS